MCTYLPGPGCLFNLLYYCAGDEQVQGLRGEIRTGYSEILAIDPEFCAAKDVELLLWKNCYYKRIEVGNIEILVGNTGRSTVG